MKFQKAILVLLLLSTSLFAQKTPANIYSAVDKKALQLPDSLTKKTQTIAGYIASNFSNEKDRVRAVFIWVASNIQYDIENMYAINFYEDLDAKINKPLQTRKGICENYAALFADICTKMGIKSYVIEGYTKQNGFADYIPHAWNAALVDSTWFMFDLTWGSGYVSNDKFYKKINNTYFSALPSTLIKSHMPFDPLWQFLEYPITNQEFYESKTLQNKTKPYFNYQDSIRTYEKQDHTIQLTSTAHRIEKNGVKNSMVFDRLQHIKVELEYERQNKTIDLFNSAVTDYNESISLFNRFVEYRNKQFMPKKTDPEIKDMVDAPALKVESVRTKLSQIKNPLPSNAILVTQLINSNEELYAHIKEQQDWVKLYLSKSKGARKSMFYKMTWFGIPLN